MAEPVCFRCGRTAAIFDRQIDQWVCEGNYDCSMSRNTSHHRIGMKDGKAEGCAHSDTELRNYINFGKISNPDCPAVKRN